MTPEQVRDALAAAVQTAVANAFPTYWENADTVPIDTVGDFFLHVSVDFQAAKQASVEAHPLTRLTGNLSLTHMQKEGTGTKALMARADALNAELKHLTLSDLQLATPTPGRKQSLKGWFSQEWLVPFWTHDR